MTERWLELHDSVIESVAHCAEDVVLRLSGYVHQWESTSGARNGTGWIMPVEVHLTQVAEVPEVIPASVIWTGGIQGCEDDLENVVPIPFNRSTPVTLWLECASGQRIEVSASSISIAVGEGAPRFVEHLSDDMRPWDSST